MEGLRKWMTTISLAVLAAGVLLIGLRGWMPEAHAQDVETAAVPDCYIIYASSDSKLSESMEARLTATIREGHTNYIVTRTETNAIRLCSW